MIKMMITIVLLCKTARKQFLVPGSCDDQIPPTTPLPTLPPTHPPEVHDCDFEKDFCAWEQNDDDQFNWDRTSGHTNRHVDVINDGCRLGSDGFMDECVNQ